MSKKHELKDPFGCIIQSKIRIQMLGLLVMLCVFCTSKVTLGQDCILNNPGTNALHFQYDGSGVAFLEVHFQFIGRPQDSLTCTWSMLGTGFVTVPDGVGFQKGRIGDPIILRVHPMASRNESPLSRSASIIIKPGFGGPGGETFVLPVFQTGDPCTYKVTPSNTNNFPAQGGGGTVNVMATPSFCTWTASSDAPWITINSGRSGTGNGSVGFSISENLGPPRSGTLTVAGTPFEIKQDGQIPPSPATTDLHFGQIETRTLRGLPTGATCSSLSGSSCLEIEKVDVKGLDARDFSVPTDGCTGVALPSGGSCPITVVFAPATPGPKTAILSVVGKNGNEFFTRSLTGIAVDRTSRRLTDEQKQKLRDLAQEQRNWAILFLELGKKCPPGPAGKLCTAYFSGLATLAFSQATQAEELAKDPPDPNFTVIVQPFVNTLPMRTFDASASQAVIEAFNALQVNQEQTIAVAEAVVVSINRADGAKEAGNAFWERRQLDAAARYARIMSSLLLRQPELLANLQSLLVATGFPSITVTLQDVVDLQRSIGRDGLPGDVKDALSKFGLDDGDIENLRLFLIIADPTDISGDFPGFLTRRPLIDKLNKTGVVLQEFSSTYSVPDSACQNVCLRSPEYWLLNLNRLPGGIVFVAGAGINNAISTSNISQITIALQNEADAMQQFNRGFVALQLSLKSAGLSTFGILRSPLRCSGPSFTPVTLSSGALITNESSLADLIEQALSAIRGHRHSDFQTLAKIFKILNGQDPLGRCYLR